MSDPAVYLVFAKRGDTLSGIVRDTLGPFRSHEQWMKAVELVAAQSKISDPDLIYPDQPIILRTPTSDLVGGVRDPLLFVQDGGMCRDVFAPDPEELRKAWAEADQDERHMVENHWDILASVKLAGGLVGDAIATNQQAAEAALGKLKPPAPKVVVALRHEIAVVQQTLVQVRQDALTVFKRYGLVARTHRIIRLVPDRLAEARYAQSLRTLTARARVLKVAGKRAGWLGFLLMGATVYSDWDTPKRYRTVMSEGAGLLAGGLVGGVAGYFTCAVGTYTGRGVEKGYNAVFDDPDLQRPEAVSGGSVELLPLPRLR